MRITQTSQQTQFLSTIEALEANLAQTESGISSGLAFTTPAQNPSAAGQVDNYTQALSQSKQYTANANSAQSSLNIEDNALTSVQSELQSLRTLAVQANSGTVSSQNLAAIATQAQQIQNSLIGIANTQDGNGNYIFAGYASQTQPFSLTASGAAYAGDDGQRQVQLSAGQSISAGDTGDTVFNQIKTGNGTFQVTPGNNTGSVILGATTVDANGGYAAGTYSIAFTSPTAYNITNTATGVVTAGTYTSGGTITYGGVQVTLTGTPAAGDTFTVAPSNNQSVFTTVQNLITALQSDSTGSANASKLNNSVAAAINNIDQALNNTSTVQASVGGRLNTTTTALSIATSQQAQLQTSISALQSLDYPSAITALQSQNTTLSAALQSYSLTQGLSLFKYIGS